jgi:peptidoglycan/LPS O-acetylase OafA/YrhL
VERKQDHRPDIDGLRAVAIATVVLFHAAPRFVPSGFVGVDVFFVISGYLITSIILKDLEAGRFSFAGFYARRIKRIFPALAVVLVAVLLAGWIVLLELEYRNLGVHVAAGAGFLTNILLWREAGYFDRAAALKPLLHLWSLGVEEQFYIVWPLALVVAHWRRWRVSLFVASVGALSFAINLRMLADDSAGAFYLPFGRFWELMLGALVAAIPGATDGEPTRFRDGAALLGAALVAFALATVDANRPYPGWWALPPTVGTMLIIAAGSRTWISRRLLARAPLVQLGLISYPLYLWHWPLLSFLSRFTATAKTPKLIRLEVGAVLLSVLLAWATRALIENGANAAFRLHRARVVQVLCVAMAAIGLAGALHWPAYNAQGEIARLARLEAFAAADQAKSFREGVCFFLPHDVGDEPAAFARNGCEGDPKSPLPRLLLVGDSHSAHLYHGLSAVLRDRYNIGQFSVGFCVPLVQRLQVLGNQSATQRCKDDNAYVFSRAAALRPALIVVGANFVAYEREPGFKYPGFDEAFVDAVHELRRVSGAPILVVGQAPIWRESLPLLVADQIRSTGSAPETMAAGLDPIVLDTDRRLKATVPGDGVAYLSLLDALCRSGACKILTPGEFPNNLIGFDPSHFSDAGSLYVAQTAIAPWISGHAPEDARNR